MRLIRLSLLLLAMLLAMLLASLPVHAQDPATQQPSPKEENEGAPSERGTRRNSDPHLQYKENVELRISQIELSEFPTVRAFISVADESGIPVRTLQAEDFVITENNQSVENVRFANRDELDLPLSIMFVVDVSGSMLGINPQEGVPTPLDLEKEAIREFVSQLSQRDRVGLVTFSDAAYSPVRMTSDHQQLLAELDYLAAWGQTTLWDGLKVGIEDLNADTTEARKALIVLSDGVDTNSLETLQTVIQLYEAEAMSQNKGFSIYTLALGDQVNRSALQQLAKRTGGMHLDSPTADKLNEVYQSILNQIQNEYLIEYTSVAAAEQGKIMDISASLNNVRSTIPGEYTYRSPGLAQALGRALIPGLVAIALVLVLLVIATIYKISRRVWLTMQITALEGKDYVIGTDGIEIGTSELCQLRVASDPGMLPMHASIRETSDGYLLEVSDPDSPILFGGALLAKKLLRSGDAFMLGTTSFVFNEKELREGEGRVEEARYYREEQLGQITEQDMLSGKQSARSGGKPSAMLGSGGPYDGQRFELAEGENVIGRTEGSIVLGQDSQVSRRHCMVTLTKDTASIVDNGSSNGTSVNGQRLQPGMSQQVSRGDTLTIGSSQYRLE
ncbi:MAG: VWA domain-containing protein [Planctomycetales bacterium]|nr:VWA domain-containing protein [bacterium]UNM07854.1 MAG: VWA domain-containing protein [Planctomycetales bacterium]